LDEVSVNCTVSGTAPDARDSLNPATGACVTVAAVVTAVVTAVVVSVVTGGAVVVGTTVVTSVVTVAVVGRGVGVGVAVAVTVWFASSAVTGRTAQARRIIPAMTRIVKRDCI
jgi:hypothetical protein